MTVQEVDTTLTVDGKGRGTVGVLPHALNFANTSGGTLYVPATAFGPAWMKTLPMNVDGYDIVAGDTSTRGDDAERVGAAHGHKGCG